MKAFLRASQREAKPWKNGGGITYEILVFPSDADLSTFEWRLSIAIVSKRGAFSRFDGIGRILAVMDGQLELQPEGDGGSIRLTSKDPPLAFDGEMGLTGTPLDGRVIDLNLMTKRGVWAGRIDRIRSPHETTVSVGSGHTIIVFSGSGQITCRGQNTVMEKFDAVLIDATVEETLSLSSGDDVMVCRLEASACER